MVVNRIQEIAGSLDNDGDWYVYETEHIDDNNDNKVDDY